MKNISRRQFVRTTSAAMGAVTVPLILPSCGPNSKTRPNDKITMGFIGMGVQNRYLLRGFVSHEKIRVLAVCDVDTTRRELARNYVDSFYEQNMEGELPAKCLSYNDFRDLIANDEIDAISIATPDHWHACQTIAALRAGKDVYCEKPLTHNIHEAIEVMKAVDKYKRVLQTGSMQRSMPEFRLACELVQGGAIGKIDRVFCNFGPPGIPCDLPEEEMEPGLDWDMWIGPGPMRPYSSVLSPRGMHDHFPHWRNYKEYGGGMVCDFGAHHLDIAQWGLGMDDSGPVKVTPPKNPEAITGAVLTYANGITVTQKDLERAAVIFEGSKGIVTVDRSKFELILDDELVCSYRRQWDEPEEPGVTLESTLAMAEEAVPEDQKKRLYKSDNHLVDFINCVQSREKPITSEQVGARSAICCHLMNQAYYNHAEFEWDPKRLRLANDSGKPEWLTRDYREPWEV